MAQEIERKFLVSGDYKSQAFAQSRIIQGYISSARGRTVRVRIRDGKGYLTIKGASNASGTSRYEWEKELPLAEAEELMKDCSEYIQHLFEKTDLFNGGKLLLAKVQDEEVLEDVKKLIELRCRGKKKKA